MNHSKMFDKWTIDDTNDYKAESKYQAAMRDIRRHVEAVEIITYGKLSARFPEHKRFLDSVLKDLKDDRKLNYCEFKPAPLVITAGNCDKKIPYDDLFGRSHKSIFHDTKIAISA